MKQKMFTLFAVAILFAASTADSFAQLTKIWDLSINNYALESLCRPGKLAVVSRGNEFLIDLTNGQNIYSATSSEVIDFNYWGDRYYVYTIGEGILKEYDVKTKEFKRIAKYRIEMPDSSIFGFNTNFNSILFYNSNSGQLLDSFKIPGSPNESLYYLTKGRHFSYDGRFYAFHLQLKNNPEQNHFFLYDRQAREIILRKDLPANNDLIMQFFNKSNLMVYSEEVKLEGDDKKYSYIRIYDPDKREVVQNIKPFIDESYYASFITIRQDDKIFAHGNGKNNNIHFFDLEKKRKIDIIIPSFPGPLYLDDSLYISGEYIGYKFDWNSVSVDDEPNPNIPVIYPNPTTNTINLDIEPNLYHGQWQMTDLTGRVILNGIILPNPQLQINIENLPAQSYYLQLTKGSFVLTYQVVKL
ncbi:hypothetical protein MASR1M45_22670 [Candidatus Kapaibacterium sp.]